MFRDSASTVGLTVAAVIFVFLYETINTKSASYNSRRGWPAGGACHFYRQFSRVQDVLRGEPERSRVAPTILLPKDQPFADDVPVRLEVACSSISSVSPATSVLTQLDFSVRPAGDVQIELRKRHLQQGYSQV